MKVKYIGETYKVCLIKGKVYDVVSIENGWYQIKDEVDDAFYPPEGIEIVEE